MGEYHSLPLIPIPVAIAVGTSQIGGGAGRVVYTSVLETSGVGACSFSLFDGNPNTGRVIGDWVASAGQSVRDQWPMHGLPFTTDLFIGNCVGAGRLIVHVCPEHLWETLQAMYWRGFVRALEDAGINLVVPS